MQGGKYSGACYDDEARVSRAEGKVQELKAKTAPSLQLAEAYPELLEARRKTNEGILEGILDPLVDFLLGPGLEQHASCLRPLTQLCTTTQHTIYGRTRKLVFTPSEGVHECEIGEEIHQICHLFPYLEHVVCVDHVQNVSLHGAPSSIRTIEVRYDPKLSDSPIRRLVACQSLEVIRAPRCYNLTSIDSLHLCTALQQLDLSESVSLHADVWAALCSCSRLQVLKLVYPKSLEAFNNKGWYHVDSMKYLALSFRDNDALCDISLLPRCPALRELHIKSCPALPNETSEVLNSCKGLQVLSLEGCDEMHALPDLHSWTQIEKLAINDCKVLSDNAHLPSCLALRELVISNCPALPNEAFKALESCTALQTLELRRCEQLHSLPNLQVCSKLERLVISSCDDLSDVSSLASCPALRELGVIAWRFWPNEAFNVLNSCTGLVNLALAGCGQMHAFPNLQACTKLQKLRISDCKSLSSISNLLSCPALRELEIINCRLLPAAAFTVLELCTELQKLDLGWCDQLQAVPNLRACTKLERIHIYSCNKLSNIAHLASCPALSELEISYCMLLPSRAVRAMVSFTKLRKLR